MPETPKSVASTLEAECTQFFEAFSQAFSEFDGHVIARRYASPYLSIHSDGSSQLFSSPSAIGQYFQEIVSRYHQQGCRSCQFKELNVVPLGRNAVLASVTWELLAESKLLISAWRESYNLVRNNDALLIHVSTDHAA